ncbi:MAG: ATP-dependent DNA helicase RecG [Lachnospiraceae bacterium]|nr:ATP-dependent DNA helicase RecG [Lachnospiraceae bacterium]
MNEEPLSKLKGVGEKTYALFNKLKITTLDELINTFPRTYNTYEKPGLVKDISPDRICTVYACVNSYPVTKKMRRVSLTQLSAGDSTGSFEMVFFNMPFISKVLRKGNFYVFRGKVSRKGKGMVMEQPSFYGYSDYLSLTDSLWPVYPLTKGLSTKTYLKVMEKAMEYCDLEEEDLSSEILERYDMYPLKKAYLKIHFPDDEMTAIKARKRFVFREFFDFLMLAHHNKEEFLGSKNQYKMMETADTVRLIESLPYELTNAQKKVWAQIRDDMASNYTMNRLIQGDVGSGKTIIALLSLLMCAANGYQGALMAPTETLAIQHYETVAKMEKENKLCFKPVLLVGSMTAKEKKEAYEKIKSGEYNLVIGTHALIQDKVEYKNLALVICDEQHRFGVKQREKLFNKGNNPHLCVMSATPIPRTLALIVYGDLDISVLDEKPSMRLPIKNAVVNTSYRPNTYKFIAEHALKGEQIYVICPMIEPSENSDEENVVDYFEKLKGVLPEKLNITYLHGKMSPADKNEVMNNFNEGNIDVLVSTTVIEVGINVANATVMVIENAERFGLAQLHQLRGRVGRSDKQSYCVFISSKDDEESIKRLEILRDSNDGFEIAKKDLELRGPGQMFGIRQSGELGFKIGDLYKDSDVLAYAHEFVKEFVKDPSHKEKELYKKWEERVLNTVDFRTI